MTGYKIAAYHDGTEWKPCMVALEIPEDALVVRPLSADATLDQLVEERTRLPEYIKVQAYSKKLRCDKAKVVSIVDLEDRSIKLGSAVSLYALVRCIDTAMPFYAFPKQILISLRCIMDSACTLPGGIYKPGEIVEPHDFSTAKTEECAPGIHFFLTEEDAMDFYMSPRAKGIRSWPEVVISDANKYTALRKALEKEE